MRPGYEHRLLLRRDKPQETPFATLHQTAQAKWHFDPDNDRLLLVYAKRDIALLNQKKPPKAEAEQAAERNLKLIMDQVADYVGKPHPAWST